MTGMDENELWDALGPLQNSNLHISDYIEEVSRILFLKAVSESNRVTFDKTPEGKGGAVHLAKEYRWERIVDADNSKKQLNTYKEAIERLADDGELAKDFFEGYTTKFNKASTFKKLTGNLEKMHLSQNNDNFGDAYEFLLEKYADKAEGAGEYFTPREVIQAMVEFSDPKVDESVLDPASGTGGFLIHTYNYLADKTDNFRNVEQVPVEDHFRAQEIVTSTHELGGMNMLLHGMDASAVDRKDKDGDLSRDSLEMFRRDRYEETYDYIIANPPYGGDNDVEPIDPKCTSTIEINFLVLIMRLLSENGRASVVIPDGILFNQSFSSVREELLNYFNIDCILALPEGAFTPYADVTANVIFFERDNDGTDEFWYYDARSGFDKVNKEKNPLDYDKHLSDFVEYKGKRDENDEYFKIDADEVDEGNYELHLKKYKEFKYEGHRPPSEIARDIKSELEVIRTELDQMVGDSDD
jgi:type I restriction enzyme M protein